jgi:valyl-tRNA synthetase
VPAADLTVADRWIRSRLGRTLSAVEAALRDYRFDFAASALYEFAWYDFCDWYLELTKPVLQSQDAAPATRLATQRTLAEVLEALQRALHPIMPFIAPLAGVSGTTVMLAPYPGPADFPIDAAAEGEAEWLKAVILGVRQIRGEMNIAPGKRIGLLLKDASALDESLAQRHRALLEKLAGLAAITVLAPGASAPESAMALVGTLTLLVPMAGLIDAGAEAERLEKLLAKAQGELKKTRGKLGNENFVANAPPEVVATEREREADFERTARDLGAQLARIRGMLAQ